MRLIVTLLLLAAVALTSAVADNAEDPDWNEGWDQDPCAYGDCDVPTTQRVTTTTKKPTTPKRSTKAPKTPKTKSSHRDECTAPEKRKAGCLHGGVCFVIELNQRAVYCHCTHNYIGRRCEEFDGQHYVISAGIKAVIGVSVALVALLVVGIVVFVCYRRNRKKQTSGVSTVVYHNQNGDGQEKEKEAEPMIKEGIPKVDV